MNDERSGQLAASGWEIPEYLRNMLYLESDGSAAKVQGETGLFELSEPAQRLILRWGGATGPALNELRWQPDSLDWEGDVRLGGKIESIHVTETGEDFPLCIVTLNGVPLKAGYKPFSLARLVKHPPMSHNQNSVEMFALTKVEPTISTWLVMFDNPMAEVVNQALLHNRHIHLFGTFAPEVLGWHNLITMPILLESATLTSF